MCLMSVIVKGSAQRHGNFMANRRTFCITDGTHNICLLGSTVFRWNGKTKLELRTLWLGQTVGILAVRIADEASLRHETQFWAPETTGGDTDKIIRGWNWAVTCERFLKAATKSCVLSVFSAGKPKHNYAKFQIRELSWQLGDANKTRAQVARLTITTCYRLETSRKSDAWEEGLSRASLQNLL